MFTQIFVRSRRDLNSWEKSAIDRLHQRGLTADLLLNYDESGDKFDEKHYLALSNLVLEQNIPLVEAMGMIQDLTLNQIHSIAKGLTFEDVRYLANFWHLTAMIKLKQHGLTTAMLLSRPNNGHDFDENHYFALHKLVLSDGLSAQAALNTIDGMDYLQAQAIQKGLEHDEILEMNSTDLAYYDQVLVRTGMR